ncbi:MAG: CoA transferase, partial [Chloroflexota bacterium]|nr:CoA transferase [Chloroflexota bacterium]
MTNRTDSQVALREIWGFGGLDDSIIEEIKLTGLEPILPSVYKTGVAAQATIAASGLSAAEIWNFRTGRSQDLSVDMKHAAIG